MKKPKTIKIAVEFEVREDVWLKLPDDLRDKGTLARAEIYELTPADLVAFMVMGAALSTPNAPREGRAVARTIDADVGREDGR
jgi:hypothetical protein